MKTKKDFIVWVIVFIFIGLFLWQLPNIYNMVFSKEPKKDNKKEEVVEIIPSSYSCNLIDNSTDENGYTTIQTVNFNIDKSGNVKDGTIDIEYAFINKDLYNTEKSKEVASNGLEVSIDNDDINSKRKINVKVDYSKYKSVDSDSLVINLVNGFPTEYKKLEKYLSNNLYSCTKK